MAANEISAEFSKLSPDLKGYISLFPPDSVSVIIKTMDDGSLSISTNDTRGSLPCALPIEPSEMPVAEKIAQMPDLFQDFYKKVDQRLRYDPGAMTPTARDFHSRPVEFRKCIVEELLVMYFKPDEASMEEEDKWVILTGVALEALVKGLDRHWDEIGAAFEDSPVPSWDERRKLMGKFLREGNEMIRQGR